MSLQTISPAQRHGGVWGARVLVLALMGAACGLALEATAEAHGVAKASLTRPLSKELVSLGLPDLAPAPPPVPERLVWRGLDIDGDGQDDFANPTGGAVRACDDFGCGAFGADRDHGEREHEGVDYDARAGQAVHAPISGYVTRIGYAYPGDDRYRFIEISNPALHYMARVFYVDPRVGEGQAVHIGQPIGDAHSLQPRYPGITNHVHLEIGRLGGRRLDAARFISARMEPARPALDYAQAAAAPSRG